MRDLVPLRAAPVDGPESGPFPAVRASAACAPNDSAGLSLAAPTSPASHPTDEDLSAGTPLSHHRRPRSPSSACGYVFSFASLQGEKKKTPPRADKEKTMEYQSNNSNSAVITASNGTANGTASNTASGSENRKLATA